MKILKNNFSLFNSAGIALLSTVLLISSCSDDNHPEQPASLKVISGVTGDSQYLVKVNGTQLSDTALTYRKSLAYKSVVTGTAELVVTDQATGNVVSSSPLNLPPGTASSAYLISDATSKVSVFTIRDDFSLPTASKARIRFVNVSPTAGPLDLTISGQSTPIFTGVTFKGATQFVDIDPAIAITFVITQTGKTEPLATLPSIPVARGTFKTLWAVNPQAISESSTVSLGMISNK
jgi:hypothetical protein